jgi:hypothetical protein
MTCFWGKESSFLNEIINPMFYKEIITIKWIKIQNMHIILWEDELIC